MNTDTVLDSSPLSSPHHAVVDTPWLSRALWLVAALLLGGGLVFWVAANWPTQTRQFKLTLLYAAVAVPVLGAIALPKLRTAGLLLGTLALGGLLAFVGQTYQTGADAWQLFAAWALLALPWTVLARRDGLWALWVLIVATAIAMWSGPSLFNPIGLLWRATATTDVVLTLLWLAVLAVPMALARWGRLQPQAEPTLTLRVAVLLALAAWTTGAIAGLFMDDRAALLALNALLVLVTALWLWRRQPRDLVLLAMAVFSIDAVLLAGLARVLSKGVFNMGAGGLLLFTLAAATCLGVSATWLYRLHQTEAGHA